MIIDAPSGECCMVGSKEYQHTTFFEKTLYGLNEALPVYNIDDQNPGRRREMLYRLKETSCQYNIYGKNDARRKRMLYRLKESSCQYNIYRKNAEGRARVLYGGL